VTVKEQRVYGSWYDLSYLRCILSGFKRNRSVKIPSNQFMPRRFYTTSNNINPKTYSLIILPWFVTGFTDAEGCFTIIARKSPILWGWSPSGARPKGQSPSGTRSSTGWKIEASFIINLHKKDVKLLKAIQDFFGGIGRISKERMVVVILQLVL